MKKILSAIRNFFLTILVVVVLILTTICIVIASPFRWLQYRKSHFFRDTGTPFKIGIMDQFTFVLYELIQKEKLPIRYLMPQDPKMACDGFFLAGSTLLIHNLPGIFYEERLGGWTAYPEDEEPLSDTVAAILLRLHEAFPNEEVAEVRILTDIDNESPDHLNRIRQDPLFIPYEDAKDLPKLLHDHNII